MFKEALRMFERGSLLSKSFHWWSIWESWGAGTFALEGVISQSMWSHSTSLCCGRAALQHRMGCGTSASPLTCQSPQTSQSCNICLQLSCWAFLFSALWHCSVVTCSFLPRKSAFFSFLSPTSVRVKDTQVFQCHSRMASALFAGSRGWAVVCSWWLVQCHPVQFVRAPVRLFLPLPCLSVRGWSLPRWIDGGSLGAPSVGRGSRAVAHRAAQRARFTAWLVSSETSILYLILALESWEEGL